jgi:uncharacterized protein YbaR (Trm112 family)
MTEDTATTDGELDPRLVEILACPEDKGPLLYFADEAALYNPRLRRRYPIREGIPVMLIDEAISVDDDEDERLTAKAEADGITPNFDPDDAGSPRTGSGGAGSEEPAADDTDSGDPGSD